MYAYTIGPAIFVIFMIAAITGYNTVEGHLVLGSTVSVISSIAVVSSYIMIVPWRKHPSVLILYRSITSMIFAVNIILNSISNDSTDCRGFGFVTQFMLLYGECWLTTIAIDLVHSLTNPFISYRYNLQRFQIYNTSFCVLLSIIFFFHRDCHGTYESICWLKINHNAGNSPCLWGYFISWILLMYAYQIYATLFAYNRLRKGLSSSFDIRKQCAYDTFKCLSIYAIYLSILVISFIIVSSRADPNPYAPINNFGLVLLYFISCRGFVDAIAWFLLHDFLRSDSNSSAVTSAASQQERDDEGGAGNSDAVQNPLASVDVERGYKKVTVDNKDDANDDEDEEETQRRAALRSRARTMSIAMMGESVKDLSYEVSKEVSKGISDIAAAAVAEIDEADLSPQVNIALRQQVVQYVTLGVRQAITTPSPEPITKTFLQEVSEFVFPVNDFAFVDGLVEKEYILDELHPFKSFAPEVFKALREQEGISDAHYLKTLSSTANERLSEGASGK